MAQARKNFVITGASSGIGAALATMLAARGANIILAARRLERLDDLVRKLSPASAGKIIPLRCDVTVTEEASEVVGRAVREFGSLDVLINNAGRGHFGTVEETTDEVIRSIFAVNVFSLWNTTRPALAVMRAQKSGHIINVASMAGKVGFPLNSAYVAAKHACVGFTKALRLELLDSGVQASVVCPAGVFTEWASVTEGSPMLPLFEMAAPLAARIATDRGIEQPAIEGPVAPEIVAEKIIACIDRPTAEVYVQAGSKEFARFAAGDPESAERMQTPSALGEREAYLRLRQSR